LLHQKKNKAVHKNGSLVQNNQNPAISFFPLAPAANLIESKGSGFFGNTLSQAVFRPTP
jgi:hypothetical protein